MLTSPTNWNSLWANPNSEMRVKVIVYPTRTANASLVYWNEDLTNCRLEASLFSDMSLGNVASACLTFTIADAAQYYSVFRRGQHVKLEVYLRNGALTSGRADQGYFFIDSTKIVNGTNIEVVAYDGIYWILGLKSGYSSAVTANSYIARIRNIAAGRNRYMYTRVFSATAVNEAIKWSIPEGLSGDKTLGSDIKVPAGTGDLEAERVFGYIALAAGGNFFIDKSNQLKLCRFDKDCQWVNSEPGNQNQIVTASSLNAGDLSADRAYPLISTSSVKPEFSGYWLNGNLDSKIGVTADTLYYMSRNANNLDWHQFANVEVNGAYVSPLIELGDIVYIPVAGSEHGRYWSFPVYSYSLDFSGGCWGRLGFPKSENSLLFTLLDDQGWFTFNSFDFNTSITRVKPQLQITGRRTFSLTIRPSLNNIAALRTNNSAIDTVSMQISYRYGGTTKYTTVTGYLIDRVVPGLGSYVTFNYVTNSELPDELFDGATQIANDNVYWKLPGNTEEGTEVNLTYAPGYTPN